MQQSTVERDIDVVAVAVQELVDAEFEKAGSVIGGSALDQAGLSNGLQLIREYLQYGEAGLALDHLLYMVRELDLTISADSHAALTRAARAMKVRPEAFDSVKVAGRLTV